MTFSGESLDWVIKKHLKKKKCERKAKKSKGAIFGREETLWKSISAFSIETWSKSNDPSRYKIVTKKL